MKQTKVKFIETVVYPCSSTVVALLPLSTNDDKYVLSGVQTRPLKSKNLCTIKFYNILIIIHFVLHFILPTHHLFEKTKFREK